MPQTLSVASAAKEVAAAIDLGTDADPDNAVDVLPANADMNSTDGASGGGAAHVAATAGRDVAPPHTLPNTHEKVLERIRSQFSKEQLLEHLNNGMQLRFSQPRCQVENYYPSGVLQQ